ncbi:MAG: trehalose-phosphatase [Synergistaceae bacterium]|nr:trehalose-phosphatase [Synergistaceae bacterium]
MFVTDYDGTLAPFVKEREKAFLAPATRSLLKSICDAGGKIIIVSGRKTEEIYDFVGIPVEIWGCHGMEKRDKNGRTARMYIPEEMLKKLDDFSSLLTSFLCKAKAVEKKPCGIALHWRDRPEILDMYAQISGRLISEAYAHSLKVLPFNGGVEFMLPCFTKGTALTEIMANHHDSSPLCYLGDDTTDEDAFEEIQKVSYGIGILVSNKNKSSSANVYIQKAEVDLFLDFWLNEITVKGGADHVNK